MIDNFSGGSNSPAQTLAQTGGAPLLAHVAMGANVKDVLSGYFGASNYDQWIKTLPDDQSQLVEGVRNQLESIQNNMDLRNQAVQKIVNDFPSIAAHAATVQQQAKQAAGQEFDDTTKGYIDQALNGVASKYAAQGMLSSGAAAAATARAGAEFGEQKLGFINNRADTAYKNDLTGWKAQYDNANAERTQEQDMLGLITKKGDKAQQNALDRTTDYNDKMAGYANKLQLANQGAQSAMLGAIGGLGSGMIMSSYYNSPRSQPSLFGSYSSTPSVPDPTDQVDIG